MAVLSDMLSPLSPNDSYLTGYPLKAASRYVLARTWLATEMKRPGCVWTHSLVMSYGTLAVLNDPSELLASFRRPTEENLEQFNRPCPYQGMPGTGSLANVNERKFQGDPRSELLLTTIYARGPDSRRQFLIEATNREKDEALALALWRQMWPRLRRSFFFATAISGPLDIFDADLVILFSHDPRYTGLNPEASTLNFPVTSRPGFKLLVRDLPRVNPTSFRRFLWRYAADAPDLWDVAVPLADTFALLDQPNRQGAIRSAARLVRMHFPRADDCRLIKSDLLLGNIRKGWSGSAGFEEFNQALAELCNLPNFSDATAIGRRLTELNLSPRQVAQVIEASMSSDAGTVGDAVVRVLATELPMSIIASADCPVEAKLRLVEHNVGLVGVSEFWPKGPNERLAILNALARPSFPRIDTTALLAGLAGRIGAEEANWIVSYDPKAICQLLKSLTSSADNAEAIFRVLVRHPDTLLDGLQHCGALTREVVVHMGAVIDYTETEAIFDWSMWASVTASEEWDRPLDDHPHMAAVLFKAALKAPLQPGARLLRISFDLLHERAAAGTLEQGIRNDLGRYLPFLGWFSEWDFCGKLRAAVATYCASVPRDQSLLSVLQISDNEFTLAEILRSLRTQADGEVFLQELEHQACLGSVESYRLDTLRQILAEPRQFRWF
jgi:hypothetical protein